MNGVDRGGDPEVRDLRGEGPGESGGQGIPPLEASACNPADHPIASDRGLVNLGVDHSYRGPAWQEGEDLAVVGEPYRWVHCAWTGCGAEIRNVKPARLAHIRMHVRAAARVTCAGGDAPVVRARMAVTQTEIARRARIDVSSVNKILNGVVGPVFRRETIERVHRIARKLGYRYPSRGKKSQADAGRALIAAGAALSVAAAPLPKPYSDQLLAKLLELDLALADARKIWPSEEDLRKAKAEKNAKAVGA